VSVRIGDKTYILTNNHVLKDPEKRAAYDQLGVDWKAGQDFRPPPDWDQGFEFHGVSVRRVRCAQRLEQDLGVNVAGAALALDLIEELERLRTRLRRFEGCFEPWQHRAASIRPPTRLAYQQALALGKNRWRKNPQTRSP